MIIRVIRSGVTTALVLVVMMMLMMIMVIELLQNPHWHYPRPSHGTPRDRHVHVSQPPVVVCVRPPAASLSPQVGAYLHPDPAAVDDSVRPQCPASLETLLLTLTLMLLLQLRLRPYAFPSRGAVALHA